MAAEREIPGVKESLSLAQTQEKGVATSCKQERVSAEKGKKRFVSVPGAEVIKRFSVSGMDLGQMGQY